MKLKIKKLLMYSVCLCGSIVKDCSKKSCTQVMNRQEQEH